MKTIHLPLIQSNPSIYTDVKDTLESGALVCFPTPSGYKLAADFTSAKAIMGMIQAKRRVKNAPSLVLVPDTKWVEEIAAQISSDAKTLMETFWPGPLTLLLLAHQELPSNVKKALTGAKGWLGVRLPDDEVSKNILRVFGKPIIVSSANLAKKHGSHSVAQIKKNFGRTVDIMIDAGDLPPPKNSTLVDMTKDSTSLVVRAGMISEAQIMQALHFA